MTKKDYIKIAKILQEERLQAREHSYRSTDDRYITHVTVVDNITLQLCSLFEDDNPRFDADRFKAAVNVYLD